MYRTSLNEFFYALKLSEVIWAGLLLPDFLPSLSFHFQASQNWFYGVLLLYFFDSISYYKVFTLD